MQYVTRNRSLVGYVAEMFKELFLEGITLSFVADYPQGIPNIS